MKSFFEGIEDLFVNGVLKLWDTFRFLELENWWAANTVNWIFMIIGAAAMVYWMFELKKYSDNDEEDKSISSHSYL